MPKSRYAVNAADLHTFSMDPEYKIMVVHMIFPVLNIEPVSDIVDAEPGRMDGMAVTVQDIPQERIDAILQIVRKGLGQRKGLSKNVFRIYKEEGGKWIRV